MAIRHVRRLATPWAPLTGRRDAMASIVDARGRWRRATSPAPIDEGGGLPNWRDCHPSPCHVFAVPPAADEKAATVGAFLGRLEVARLLKEASDDRIEAAASNPRRIRAASTQDKGGIRP